MADSDSLAHVLTAIRGHPDEIRRVRIVEGRIAHHDGEAEAAAAHPADELAAVGLKHLNELVFNNCTATDVLEWDVVSF